MANTRQARAVAKALSESRGFVSAQQLYAKLSADGERTGLATVYRRLAALADAGQADVLRTPDGETRYRLCETAEHHHHLLCRRCGFAIELDAPDVEAWAAQVARRHGFSEVSHEIELYGLCPGCTTASGS